MTDTGTDYYLRFLQGDTQALEELVRLYGDSLVRYVCCFVKNEAAAEDIMADTFATLIVKRKKFTQNAQFKTYLYRIAHNKAMDFLRKTKRLLPWNELENVLCDDSPEPEILLRERRETLYRAMQNLPVQYKDVLYLRYIDGFTLPELSRILKKNSKQVYNLLARAKPALKKLLNEEGVFNEEF